MVTNDRTTSDITKRIFREVSRLAWNGKLESKKEFLPETIIPGPLPQFRCCIYREREIIRQRLKEQGIDASELAVKVCNGALECKNALTLMKLGKLPENFMEGMICEGGCVSGPSRQKSLNELKKDRDAMIGRADDRGVHENLKIMNAEQVPMHRD